MKLWISAVTIGIALAATLGAQPPRRKASTGAGSESRSRSAARSASRHSTASSAKPATQSQPEPGTAAAATAGEKKDDRTYTQNKTPFGTTRYENKPEPPVVEGAPSDIRAFQDGETVRFEKKTPFGYSRWSKKMSELDESERAILDRESLGKSGTPKAKQ